MQRSLVLPAVGAVIGLALAGYALFTAKGTSSLTVPADAVATVNDQPIARSDFIAALQAVYAVGVTEATAAQRHQVLDDLIREELFVQRGKELDVAGVDADVRAAMVRAVEESAAADAVTRTPDDGQMRAYFAAHRDHYVNEGSMTLRDLLFPPEGAAAAAALLRQGRDAVDVLAAQGGRDTGAVKGEEFYFAAKIHLGDDLFAAVRDLPDGAVAGPIVGAGGSHVMLMVHNHRPPPVTYDEALARIRSDFIQDAIHSLQSKQAAFLRRRANIRLADDMQ